ncbi:hypothetical protein DFA_05683 [Cavenderia fasciculata]|uniref:Ankyrin repeat-containing protein n=1 Tax=Cavenderia fasciculata TaxID=261658 RepID=F4PLZ6_CACFS|nr:uncharacterized protein DFA_05683 [Cavenderia fasciculata]EGG23550.1 hypothetical protein DFA_05683 [Cavenderia fasciculata]|eukprot:XP_004361401.1 hypothetical protein DFA_05683 [Cavenderia fasciculata]
MDHSIYTLFASVFHSLVIRQTIFQHIYGLNRDLSLLKYRSTSQHLTNNNKRIAPHHKKQQQQQFYRWQQHIKDNVYLLIRFGFKSYLVQYIECLESKYEPFQWRSTDANRGGGEQRERFIPNLEWFINEACIGRRLEIVEYFYNRYNKNQPEVIYYIYKASLIHGPFIIFKYIYNLHPNNTYIRTISDKYSIIDQDIYLFCFNIYKHQQQIDHQPTNNNINNNNNQIIDLNNNQIIYEYRSFDIVFYICDHILNHKWDGKSLKKLLLGYLKFNIEKITCQEYQSILKKIDSLNGDIVDLIVVDINILALQDGRGDILEFNFKRCPNTLKHYLASHLFSKYFYDIKSPLAYQELQVLKVILVDLEERLANYYHRKIMPSTLRIDSYQHADNLLYLVDQITLLLQKYQNEPDIIKVVPQLEFQPSLLNLAFQKKDQKVVELLISQIFDRDTIKSQVVYPTDIHSILYAESLGATLAYNLILTNMFRQNNVDMVKWLLENRCPPKNPLDAKVMLHGAVCLSNDPSLISYVYWQLYNRLSASVDKTTTTTSDEQQDLKKAIISRDIIVQSMKLYDSHLVVKFFLEQLDETSQSSILTKIEFHPIKSPDTIKYLIDLYLKLEKKQPNQVDFRKINYANSSFGLIKVYDPKHRQVFEYFDTINFSPLTLESCLAFSAPPSTPDDYINLLDLIIKLSNNHSNNQIPRLLDYATKINSIDLIRFTLFNFKNNNNLKCPTSSLGGIDIIDFLN